VSGVDDGSGPSCAAMLTIAITSNGHKKPGSSGTATTGASIGAPIPNTKSVIVRSSGGAIARVAGAILQRWTRQRLFRLCPQALIA